MPKKYSRSEIRRDQLELLQIRAYQSLRFLRGRLIAEETTDETDIAETVERILRLDRVLLATMRLLGDSSSWEPEASERDLLLASLTSDPDEHQVDALIAASVSA